jgi:hypothetical protein
MRIELGIGVKMMLSMVTGPPDRTSLARGTPQYCHQKSKRTTALKGAMREKPMVKRSNQEHPPQIEPQSKRHRKPADADPDNSEASKMNC